MENLPKSLVDEINFQIIKNLKHLKNVYGRVDIYIDATVFKIFKQYGINGRFKKNENFEKLIKFKIRANDSGEFFTYKDLQVKIRTYKPISFTNEQHKRLLISKPYSLLSLRFVRVNNVFN